MEYFGLTDKGRVRPTNQDIFQIEAREDNQTALLVVCDGMGGANAGNVASRFAAQSFIESAGDALSGTLDVYKRQLQGLRHLYSCVTLPNEKSIRMQRRLGFADAGVWHDSGWKFDGWHDVAWLEKHIGSGKPQPVTPFPALDEKNIQECLQKYMDKLNQVEE